MNYRVPGHAGKIGVIAAYSRTFCGTCNRIRITPVGALKTCLYDNRSLNLRDPMRAGSTDSELTDLLLAAFRNRYRDGWEAERARSGHPVEESMATIGG
jgi:cyclic pyranopterin phosphate synthase